MDFTNLIFWIPIALFVAVFFIWLGFKIPAKLHASSLNANKIERAPLPETLPLVLRSFLERNFGSPALAPVSLVAWGRGKIIVARFKFLGPLWAPLRWTIHLLPSQSFIYRIQVTWFGRPFISGGDELIQGKGRFKAASKILEGPNLDRSETTLFWLNQLLTAPVALVWDPSLKWGAVDMHTLRLWTPAPDGEEFSFDLAFDPESHQLFQVKTQRTASADGKPFPYQVLLDRYGPFEDGVVLPGRMRAAWGDDFVLSLEMKGVRYNVDVQEEIEKGI